MAKNTILGKTIESLRERLAKDPLSRAFLQLAEEYRKLGRFEEATEVCLQGLKRHPAYLPARIALGRTYLEAGNLDLAHQTLAEVHRTMPENHLAGKLLAEVQRRMGQPHEAAETYRAMLRHSPGDREVEALLHDLQGPQEPSAAAEIAATPGSPAPAPPSADPALDYRPEDLRPAADRRGAPAAKRPIEAVTAPRTQREEAPAPPGLPEREEGGQPWPAFEAAQEPGMGRGADEEQDALQTNTLAELYLRQGLVERALEVYRAMLRLDPANERLRQRLEELAPGGAPPGPALPHEKESHETGFQWTGTPQDEAAQTEAWRAPEAGSVPEPRSARETESAPDLPPFLTAPGSHAPAPRPLQKVLRLERWLQAIQRGTVAAAREARDR